MKKIIGLCILSAIFLIGCTKDNSTINEIEILDNPEKECERIGKEWKEFSDGCVDSCEKERESSVLCTTVLTDGCDCGSDQCWNGRTCEDNQLKRIF